MEEDEDEEEAEDQENGRSSKRRKLSGGLLSSAPPLARVPLSEDTPRGIANDRHIAFNAGPQTAESHQARKRTHLEASSPPKLQLLLDYSQIRKVLFPTARYRYFPVRITTPIRKGEDLLKKLVAEVAT